MSKIGKVEVHAFQFDAHNLGFTRGEGVGAFGYKKDSKIRDLFTTT